MAHYFLAHHEQQMIFAFSPKCASTTLREWFRAAEPSGRPLRGVEPRDPRYGGYRKIFFVRDPMRRLVSFYGNWVVRSDHDDWRFADDEARFRLEGKSFRQLLFVLDHLRRYGLSYQHHLVPQLVGTEGVEFDEVIKVERLAEGLARLNERMGISTPLPAANAQPYRGTPEPAADRPPQWLRKHGMPPSDFFYDDETRALATAAYSEDIAFYRELPTDVEDSGA